MLRPHVGLYVNITIGSLISVNIRRSQWAGSGQDGHFRSQQNVKPLCNVGLILQQQRHEVETFPATNPGRALLPHAEAITQF